MGDLRAAIRSLVGTPGPTLVVLATLAIAIGANAAIFSIVNGVLLRPLGYHDDGAIVVPWSTSGGDTRALSRLSPADYRDLRDTAEAFGGQVALYRFIGSTLTGFDRPVRVGSMTVTTQLFAVLGARPAAGQFFVEEDGRPGGAKKVVITHASWTRTFGSDPALVGSTIELDSVPYLVVGVAEPGFQFPPGNDEVELYFPMTISDAVLLDRNHRMFDGVARLADGVTLEAARSELDALAAQLEREFPDSNAGWGLTANPLRQEVIGDVATTLWVLSGAVFLVLLVACANIANVLVARSTVASREFAVRAALGARPFDLVKRSLSESLVLGALGGAAGLLVAYLATPILRSVMPPSIPRVAAIGVDVSVLLFAAILSIGCGVLFGAVPALRSMRPDLAELLKTTSGAAGRSMGGRRMREVMVVVEVALAIVLLVGAGLMVRSFARLSEVDPGFRQESVVSVAVQLPGSRYGRAEWRPFFEQLVDRVRDIPGVLGAGAVSDLPMSSVGLDFEMEFSVIGVEPLSASVRPNADFRLVVPGYFEAMDMRIVSGRGFDHLDAAGTQTVGIINETLAGRYFAGADPIGQRLGMAMLGEVEIVGVVSDIRHQGLQAKYEAEVFLPYGKISTAEMHVVVHSGLDTAAVANAVGDVLADMDAELAPSQVVAIADLLWESVAQPRFNTALLAGLALCAALLAVVGVYGVVAYSVARRTGEIGVRMALGADAASTVRMIVRQALGIVAAGLVLGILGALGATRFVGQLLFDVQPTDPITYAVVLVGAVLIGTLAAWLPARRATRIDPVTALREA